jgi:hypothetical protein
LESGSQITGSINVSGSISISSGSFYSGSGRFLFDIPESALSFAPYKIVSGSITASVSPDYGFRVESADSGSEFTGSVRVSGSVNIDNSLTVTNSVIANEFSGSFSGSGANLFDIPLSALVQNVYQIATGSVTASVDPNIGFIVNSNATITGSLIVSSSATLQQGLNVLGNVDVDTLNSGSYGTINLSGSTNITGALDIIGDAHLHNDLYVDGKIIANQILTNLISSSIIYSSGSNIFGSDVTNFQQFTGSLYVSGGVDGGVFVGVCDGAGHGVPTSEVLPFWKNQ